MRAVVMEYLEQLDTDHQQLNDIRRLKLKKRQLQQQLRDLTNKTFEERQEDIQSPEETELRNLRQTLQSYRQTGLSIKSMGATVVLQFDPTFRNQYSSADTYCVEVAQQEEEYSVVRHSIPAFIPLPEMEDKFLGRDLRGFTQCVGDYLYAFIQRQETVRLAKEDVCKERLSREPQTNLPVTYVNLTLKVKDTASTLNIVLDYDLLRSLPTACEINTNAADDTETSYRIPVKSLKKWKQLLLSEPMLSALTEILNDI